MDAAPNMDRDRLAPGEPAQGSPRRRTLHGRPAQESPGTLRGQPGSVSLARQRLGDVTNLPTGPSPSAPDALSADLPTTSPSPALQRFRNIVSEPQLPRGELIIRTATPGAPGFVLPASAFSAGQPASMRMSTPQTLLSHLGAMLSQPGSQQSLQSLLSASLAVSSPLELASPAAAVPSIVPPIRPPRPPPRKCCVCHETKTAKFYNLSTSWLKAAFVLIGRPFPGCFGTSSQACSLCTMRTLCFFASLMADPADCAT